MKYEDAKGVVISDLGDSLSVQRGVEVLVGRPCTGKPLIKP